MNSCEIINLFTDHIAGLVFHAAPKMADDSDEDVDIECDFEIERRWAMLICFTFVHFILYVYMKYHSK